jgi:hypothetical protein
MCITNIFYDELNLLCVVIQLLAVLGNLTTLSLRGGVTTARPYLQPNIMCVARAGKKVVCTGTQTMGLDSLSGPEKAAHATK